MREAPKFSPTKKQLNYLALLGASSEEIKLAESQTFELVSTMISKRVNEFIKPFEQGAIVELEGRRGVITKAPIYQRQNEDQSRSWEEKWIVIYWYDTKQHHPPQPAIDFFLKGLRVTGERDEVIIIEESDELRIKKRLAGLRRQFGDNLIGRGATKDRARLLKMQEYIESKKARPLKDLSDDELDDELLYIFRNPRTWWKETKE